MIVIPIDPAEIARAHDVLGTIVKARAEQARETSVIASDVGEMWKGRAATAFLACLSESADEERRLADYAGRVASVLSRLRADLQDSEGAARMANTYAAQHNLPLEDDGSVPVSVWSLVEDVALGPVGWLDASEVETLRGLGQEAADSIRNAVDRALATLNSLPDLWQTTNLFGTIAVPNTAREISVAPDSLVYLASRLLIFEDGAATESNQVWSLATQLEPHMCMLFGADALCSAISWKMNCIASRLRAFSSFYATLSKRVSSAVGQYIGADQLDKLEVAVASGALVAAAPGTLALIASSPPPSAESVTSYDSPYQAWCRSKKYPTGEWTQCTGWAEYRRHQMGLSTVKASASLTGAQMAKDAGLIDPSSLPPSSPSLPQQVQAGSLVSCPGNVENPAGHVMVVERVVKRDPPTLIVSEMNYNGENNGAFSADTTLVYKQGEWYKMIPSWHKGDFFAYSKSLQFSIA